MRSVNGVVIEIIERTAATAERSPRTTVPG
jgi:hypothetical protein